MDTKTAARERLDGQYAHLLALSHRIHATPELGFEEERACSWVAEALSAAGFAVTTGICDLPTALAARAGTGPLHIAICAEPEFTAHCITAAADKALYDGALAMAWTVIDMALDTGMRMRLLAGQG